MEVINVESQTWEMMMAKFETFAQRIDALCRSIDDKSLQKWLDNQEACEILNISKRTLQSCRASGTLAYTQIGRKMYYRPEDVKQLIHKLKAK